MLTGEEIDDDVDDDENDADDNADGFDPNHHGAPPPQADSDSNDSDSDEDTPPASGPSQIQRSCQHNFDYHLGIVRCVVCTLDAEDDTYAECPTCNVRTCLDCSQNFLGNVHLNWPANEDASAEFDDDDDDNVE